MKPVDKPVDEARTATGSFECAVNLSERRTLRVTGYTYSDDTMEEINARVDAMQDVLDRQLIRADLVAKEAQITQFTQNLEHIQESFQGLLALQQSGKKLTSQQKLQIDSFDTNVKNNMKQIESLRAAIKAGKQKINGAAHA